MVSHPETGSDSPIGSDRDRGRDTHTALQIISIGCKFAYLLSLCKVGLRHVCNLG